MSIKYYNRPTLEEHNYHINNVSWDFLTSPILKTIKKYFEKRAKEKELEDFYTNLGLVRNDREEQYGVNFGYCVKNFTKSEFKKQNKTKECRQAFLI